ncbi:MAG: protein-glutamate O-methyltransferase [Alphaproteobacteria bacterium]|nr:protein-glutamate O-methyltransferase [Alphaproteobacteria bacterium]
MISLDISQQREFAFSERDFRFLSELVGERTGIVLAEHKLDMVYSRLARRLRALALSSFAQYCELVKGPDGEAEIGNLVNAITTNLTSFFRESHHFEHLRERLAELAAKPPFPKKLRIWSAGCSSGMEPYSIAMTMLEAIPGLHAWDARILATDIDTNMLATGAQGEYADSALDHIPPAYAKKYMLAPQDGRVSVSPDLRDLVAFKRLNLLESWPMRGIFDVIFCRNVVIYFDKPTQKKLFYRLADKLKPGGWLYIGHSENLHAVCDRFRLAGRTIYQRVA